MQDFITECCDESHGNAGNLHVSWYLEGGTYEKAAKKEDVRCGAGGAK